MAGSPRRCGGRGAAAGHARSTAATGRRVRAGDEGGARGGRGRLGWPPSCVPTGSTGWLAACARAPAPPPAPAFRLLRGHPPPHAATIEPVCAKQPPRAPPDKTHSPGRPPDRPAAQRGAGHPSAAPRFGPWGEGDKGKWGGGGVWKEARDAWRLAAAERALAGRVARPRRVRGRNFVDSPCRPPTAAARCPPTTHRASGNGGVRCLSAAGGGSRPHRGLQRRDPSPIPFGLLPPSTASLDVVSEKRRPTRAPPDGPPRPDGCAGRDGGGRRNGRPARRGCPQPVRGQGRVVPPRAPPVAGPPAWRRGGCLWGGKRRRGGGTASARLR